MSVSVCSERRYAICRAGIGVQTDTLREVTWHSRKPQLYSQRERSLGDTEVTSFLSSEIGFGI